MTKNINFATYSSIRIGPKVDVKLITHPQQLPKNSFIIGGSNNLLISPTPPPLVMLSKEFNFIRLEDNFVHIGAMTPSGKILSFAKRNDLANFELMQKLPGTLGGMVKMNAGLKEWEVFNHLKKILTCKGWIEKKDIEYGYRFTNIKGMIYEAVFEAKKGFDNELLAMFKKMRDNQPNYPSCGSCFKNPKDDYAGRLIEAVDLKGYQKGGMAISQKHANFLINIGNGTFDEALFLIKLCEKRVFETFGIELEREIIVV